MPRSRGRANGDRAPKHPIRGRHPSHRASGPCSRAGFQHPQVWSPPERGGRSKCRFGGWREALIAQHRQAFSYAQPCDAAVGPPPAHDSAVELAVVAEIVSSPATPERIQSVFVINTNCIRGRGARARRRPVGTTPSGEALTVERVAQPAAAAAPGYGVRARPPDR